MRITGVVLIPAGTPAFGRAVVRVRLLDVSLADAPAVTKAEYSREIFRGDTGEQRVPFHLDVHGVREELNVAAHVDLHRENRVRPGDLVSTTAVPPSPGMVVPVEVV
ncbi:hypothetical protein FXN61_22580 [Lentzea sp. PSKA42]|uniref:Uncharacterized protein n=1 Tax=Lentzea indica TaxID=2604800 RepID=A0ABX1FL61_9PSEU|nr:YbaY family lipoprotein [Lentzea indica]NKE59441.1 hypothetical protein [Lentzea indica]